jgi:hypothetical protein
LEENTLKEGSYAFLNMCISALITFLYTIELEKRGCYLDPVVSERFTVEEVVKPNQP